jgi:(p)ppGpp synthase/HD superfamily hydrolase
MINLALEVAARAHNGQVRKGTDIPYITHPFAVGILLLKAGCSEEVVMAGLLHDTLEDTSLTIEEIRSQFGQVVADIVLGCTEPNRKLPWEERKQHTLNFLRTAPMEIRWVCCADKLHNLRTIANDLNLVGDQVWSRFHRGRKKQEWYYRGVVESLWHELKDVPSGSLFHQLRDEVENFFGKQAAYS